ncbi:metallophosphoesterase [Gordonia sp. OPL2]|uniref:metallophosphoesterase family protein n=1 Tax=Gordonia sp. OPL2 TaxID=2486274 RepID=UPI00165608B0|nr:metallophosphoesterase [Gordonia sp. OPL2]ROZ88897.1 exonuclease SbcCD subunit D [Gordonia sp. OPL2]
MTVPLFELDEVTSSDGERHQGAVREVTFVHTADWQLGMTRRYLDAESAHAYGAARLDAVERIGALALEVGAEFVVVSGDVFEDHRVSSRIIRRTLDILAGFAVPVYLLPGNHDPFDAAGIYRSRTFVQACPDNVVVLSTPGVHRVRDGVEVVAAPWSHKHPGTDLVDAQVSRLRPSEDIRVVVGHGGTDETSPGDDAALIAVARLEDSIDAGLVDYVALGDRHSVTSVGRSERVWYAGAHEVTNFDTIEEQPGHALVVTLRRGPAGREVTVTPHRVGQWSFRSITRDIAGSADIEALRVELAAIEDKPRVVVRLGLVGTVTVAENAMLDDLLEEFADRFAAVTRSERDDDLVVVAADGDADDLAVSGYAQAAAQELLGLSRSDDADAAGAARDALGLLRRLAGTTR